ncbi:Kelch motif family protein [Trichomonas vaginalis G3]|uniref:Kelch motif family protein n=1 Tax=Trichomonas vaginalis (strain ATCC PRA-98 / G3) TaxID=412133 RepID=A2ES89_TRIV3|nr:nitrile biosynthetic process [Trichomonas vaginalis G3]EAY04453.1 Kelch motif family protein [Trichomonas vaginalis G3]KAI5510289.1 nitrile biosynthetic process [Trichomonas vaginalis G3]|eukprot:XP_001316676.1 Kelch motif family protein [Trichomonas vaginalis G3]
MGSGASQVVHSDAIVSAGYSSLCNTNNSGIDFFEKDEQIKVNSLAKTPFHATWYNISTLSQMLSPRQGMAYGFHSETEKILFAFGQKENLDYASDLVCYDVKTNEMSILIQNLGEGRTNSSGIMIGDYFFIFGGNNSFHYYNDLYRFNVTTLQVEFVTGIGKSPSPRSNSIMGTFDDSIYIWGGELPNGETDSNVYIFNIKNNSWSSVNSEVKPRAAASYTQMKNKIYIYGSSDNEGMLILDMQTVDFEIIKNHGQFPLPDIKYPGLVSVFPNYILCFGGTSTNKTTHLFAFDVNRKYWFIFHTKPKEGEENKGKINENGFFKVPRQFSFASVYDEKRKMILYTLSDQFTSLGVFDLSKALSKLNLGEDLLSML